MMHWDSLWYNGTLATFAETDNSSYGLVKDGAIAVKDGLIAWLGTSKELPDDLTSAAKEVHDLNGNLLMPGLVDPHTHLVFAGNRANEFALRLAGKSYEEIAKAGGGIKNTVKLTRAASFEELYTSAKQRVLNLIKHGVTSIEIKSGYGLELATEEKMLQVASKLGEDLPVSVHKTFLGAHCVPPEFTDNADAYLAEVCNNMLPYLHKKRLVDAVDVFCERIAFSKAQTERVLKAAQQLNLPIHIHAEQLSNQQGAELAASYGALSADHLEYIDADAVKALADAGTVAVLLPGAFYYLQETQQPPIELLRQAGVAMALATDANPGSSPVLSLPLILNMACTLFGLTPAEALRGVTVNAAKALGVVQQVGSLAVGKQADFSLWNAKDPAEICYWLGADLCVGTVKKGCHVHI